ncbi:UbiD family decarboxylase [Geobacter sulfurreducens]|uniref:UbiD family decarboxylase n=1 Tax=Geobacter sulfurreducens TaxID=35554 RepID=UPI002B956BEC|nr:UbiD family decarboxylase [Geobacter sulfurreducens]HML77690.1 UbiD family decarboxylase [Geobacter sulfurreducens]
MANGDLHDFLAELERLGDLHRVAAEVDPVLEVAAITDRVSKLPGGGKGLLFERVKGSRFPLVTNVFGSAGRVAAALGAATLDDLTARMESLLAAVPPAKTASPLEAMASLAEMRRFAPMIVEKAPCQEVVEAPDLLRYPFPHSWPGDGGRFITLPLVVTRDPETNTPNCGMYRVRVVDGASAGIRWYAGKGGELHCRRHRERGERMPVAVAIGGDPAAILAAILPLPEGFDEMLFAGFLRGRPLELARCRTSDLLVPAGAELVLEGYVEPGETVMDGAFGNHTGFYAPAAPVPLMRLTCITRRTDCLCPATVVGRPPMEDCYLAKAAERLLLPVLRMRWPEIVDISYPLEWIFNGGAVLSLRECSSSRVRRIVTELWSSGLAGAGRLLVAVDEGTRVDDPAEVAWRAMNAVDWRTDLIIAERDAAAAWPGLGSRLAIDATRSAARRYGAEELVPDRETARRVDSRWREYGF